MNLKVKMDVDERTLAAEMVRKNNLNKKKVARPIKLLPQRKETSSESSSSEESYDSEEE